jgi:hypothetical protein
MCSYMRVCAFTHILLRTHLREHYHFHWTVEEIQKTEQKLKDVSFLCLPYYDRIKILHVYLS